MVWEPQMFWSCHVPDLSVVAGKCNPVVCWGLYSIMGIYFERGTFPTTTAGTNEVLDLASFPLLRATIPLSPNISMVFLLVLFPKLAVSRPICATSLSSSSLLSLYNL